MQRKYGDQLRLYLSPNTYYFFMNTRVAPFTSLEVRRAVNYAIDRNALVKLYDGLATPTENVLPPTYPQYKKHDLYPYDPAKAKRLVARSGFAGTAVTVWSHQSGLDSEATSYLVGVLNSLGFEAKEKTVTSSAYWATIGNKATKAQIGFADWFQDYPHPLDWFDVLLNGEQLAKTFNSNYAAFDDPAVNARIDALRGRTPVGGREPGLGPARRGRDEAGALGAVPQPAVHRSLQPPGRPRLLCEPARLRVRLRDDLRAVARGGRARF